MTTGDRIKKLRLKLGMTQEELAKKVGYKSRSSINKIELGERDIPRSSIVAFAYALKTTPSYLMGWGRESWDKESDKFNDPKDRDTAVEIIRQLPRLSSEGLDKLKDRIEELVKLGYLSDIERELMNM